MRKDFLFYGLLALCAPIALTSCSSDDAENGGTPPNGASQAVKTSFTLSVGLPGSGASNAKPFAGTRMTDAVAQAQTTPSFRGMDNMTLIPFSTTAAITSSDTRTGSTNINLPNTTANTLLSGQITSTGNAHVYTDVSVPVGVSSFLFYGKAVDATAGTDASVAADMFKYGSLTTAGLSDGAPSGISFSPKQIYSSGAVDTKATALATYLTTIAGSTYTEGSNTYYWCPLKPEKCDQN